LHLSPCSTNIIEQSISALFYAFPCLHRTTYPVSFLRERKMEEYQEEEIVKPLMLPREIVVHRQKPKASRFKRVCVFCGSSPGKKASYQLAAIQLGDELVTN
jgi:hypothetical protein